MSLASVYDEMADAVAGHVLRCRQCCRVERPSHQDLARYFRVGWPQCCAETMLLATEVQEQRVDRSAGPGPKPGVRP